MKNKKYLIFLLPLLLSACATQMTLSYEPESVPGFFSGIWHGFIVFLSFIGSTFSSSIKIYAFPNSGWGYDLGFMIGSGLLGVGVGKLFNSQNE